MTPQALALAPYQDDPEVVEVVSQARTIADEARELTIVDEPTNNRALTMLATARKYTKSIDALKKRWLDPLNDQIKLIRGDFDQMAAPAKEADQILARKTADYRFKVAEAARKEQERLRLLAEKRQERAEARAAERGVEPPPVQPLIPTVAPPAKTVATDGGAKVTFRKQFHFEITDAGKVPREWCCPDEKKIGQAVRAEILTAENAPAGIRIWSTEEPTVR